MKKFSNLMNAGMADFQTLKIFVPLLCFMWIYYEVEDITCAMNWT